MKKAIASPRAELSPNAPRITVLHINPDSIREVIGPGGKIINKIIEECDVEIDIDPDGSVFVTAASQEGSAKAIKWIEDLTKEIKVGEEYEGTVTQIIKGQNNGDEIGAIVELIPGHDGMIHISNIAWERIDKVSDVLHIGDKVKVKVMEVDKERGRISLSRKELLPKPEGFRDRQPFRSSGHSNDRGSRPPRKPFFNKR